MEEKGQPAAAPNMTAALAYAARGWKVFPIKPNGKEPVTSHGLKDATDDPAIIRRWFGSRPDLNVGLALGASGLFCLDVDCHEKADPETGELKPEPGYETLERLEARYGRVESNCMAETATGGLHVFFANPDGVVFPAHLKGFERGIDTRNGGNYMVVYPSRRTYETAKDGELRRVEGMYTWIDGCDPLQHSEDITPLPDWLVSNFAKQREPEPEWQGEQTAPQTVPAASSANPGAVSLAPAQAAPHAGVSAVTDRQWTEVQDALAVLSAEDREDWLTIGMILHSTGRPDAFPLWCEWSAGSDRYKGFASKFDPDDQARVWKSFHAKGFDGLSVKSLFKRAYDAGWKGLEPDGARDGSEAAVTRLKPAMSREQAEAYIEVLERESTQAEVDRLLDAMSRPSEVPFVRTGFTPLDHALGGGLYEGLHIIGSTTSMGKTALVHQIADQVAMAGHDVLYYSLEMSRREMVARSVSRYTAYLAREMGASISRYASSAKRVSVGLFRDAVRAAMPRMYELIPRAAQAYREDCRHLRIVEGVGDYGVAQIAEDADRFAQATGRKPAVFIDYLQILAPADVRATDKQNMDKAAVGLKRLSRDLQTPVVAISALNRASYGYRISNEAFKESGALEYTADTVIGFEPRGMPEGDRTAGVARIQECMASNERDMECVFLKNRNGQPGMEVYFKYYSLFNLLECEGIKYPGGEADPIFRMVEQYLREREGRE